MASKKVFVVEDDPVFSKLIGKKLELSNINDVHFFSRGEDCLEQISQKPDFVLLDIGLSGLNGLDVLKKIKASNKKTKVFILTAVGDEQLKKLCLQSGASGYFVKEPDGLGHLQREVLDKINRKGLFSFFK